MKQTTYGTIRSAIYPGDVFGFGGNGVASRLIKIGTNSNVSHVATVLSTNVASGGSLVLLMESTSLGDGFAGVQITRLSDRIRDYDGDIWWLPLNSEKTVNVEKLTTFLLAQEGKPYDAIQAIGSAFDFLPDQREDLDLLYCSELISALFEHIDIIPPINASEQTPIDVCLFGVYGEICQVKGQPKELEM